MSVTLGRFVRPAALVAAVLLIAGTVHSTPASADDEDALFGFDVRAEYPYEGAPGYPGYGAVLPADAGLGPGSVSLSVMLFNRNEYTLRDLSVRSRVVTNGQIDGIRCATSPLFPDDVRLVDGVLQGESPPFPTPPPSSPGAPALSWSDAGVVLAPHMALYCAVWVSGITDKVLNETVTSLTARRVDASTPATYDAHTWAAAGKLRQGFPTPADEPVFIQGSAFVDSNENYVRDVYPDEPEKTERVLPGLRVTLTGPDGKPVPNFGTGHGVNDAQVTDQNGRYIFPHPRPLSTLTVTLDLDSPGLAGLGKERNGGGVYRPDRKSWTQTARSFGNIDVSWRFVPGNRVYLTPQAPRSVIAGTPLRITGRADRADSDPAHGPVVLESHRPRDPSNVWTKLADVTNHDGKLSVSLTAVRTTDYRFRYLGDEDTSASLSWESHVSVFTAWVALTVTGPSTARQGEPLTFSGTIQRSGKPFQSGRIALEYAPDGDYIWTRVATVRSTAGAMSATVPATGSGDYRWRYFGDSKTSAKKSSSVHVVVSP